MKESRPNSPSELKLKIEGRPTNELRPYKNNPRIHSKQQIKALANSVKEFGFLVPILIDEKGNIVAGHGRYEAAKALGLKNVPTIMVSHLTEAQRRAFIIADNKVGDLSVWNRELLKLEFESLLTSEFNFSLETTGFSTTEIDILLNKDAATDDPAEEIHSAIGGPSVSQTGDVWLLGESRLVMGDARDPACYTKVLDGKTAAMVFADVPYNVRIKGHVGGKGRISHPEFAMASGEMKPVEFVNFLRLTLGNHSSFCRDGALAYFCIDWRHYLELMEAVKEGFPHHVNTCVWVKNNAGMGGQYRSQHEFIPVLRKGTARHINNIELGKHGRTRTNVWHYDGASSFGKAREDLELHPTVKPVKLVADAILDATRRKDVVLDGFVGSGTTILAAERTGRRAAAIEIDGNYVDVAVERFERVTGKTVTLEDTGESFEAVRKRRLESHQANSDCLVRGSRGKPKSSRRSRSKFA